MKIDPQGRFSWDVVPELSRVIESASDDDVVFVDIPIGLPSGPPDTSCCVRRCDGDARQFVGARRSNVFSVPARRVVTGNWKYPEANDLNRRLLGKGLAKQAYSLVLKIREVDELLLRNRKAKAIVREVHPEVCFREFAGKELKCSKKTHNGYWERMDVLQEVSASARRAVQTDRIGDQFARDVAPDDVLDAMAAALTATAAKCALKTLPCCPQKDARGLPMEMVYTHKSDVRV